MTDPIGTGRPYGYYVILAAEDPHRVAAERTGVLCTGVAVVDCNDLGSEVLGASEGVNIQFVRRALRGAPPG